MKLATVMLLACCVGVQANVMMETVPVGNLGNAGELSGDGAGAPAAIAGAVDYAYRMGKYEVTAGQYTEFLNAVAGADPYGLYNADMWSSTGGCRIERSGAQGSYTYSVASDWAERPVNFVNWGDAARFANWMHNGQGNGDTETGAYTMNNAMSNVELTSLTREEDATWVIPSEDEWYKSAYHKNDGDTGNYFDFATSSDVAPGYVDDNDDLSGTGDAFVDGIPDPGNYATYNGDGDAWNIDPYLRTEVGEWENSPSPYGTFDQTGNVWEWNEAAPFYDERGIRGGSYDATERWVRASHRNRYYATLESPSLGFRLAYVPEPTTLAILAFGGLTLMRRRYES